MSTLRPMRIEELSISKIKRQHGVNPLSRFCGVENHPDGVLLCWEPGRRGGNYDQVQLHGIVIRGGGYTENVRAEA